MSQCREVELGRKMRIFLVISSLIPVAITVFNVFATVSPVATFKGFALSGEIRLISSRIFIGYSQASIRPLESVSQVTLSIFIGSSIVLALSSFAIYKLLKRRTID